MFYVFKMYGAQTRDTDGEMPILKTFTEAHACMFIQEERKRTGYHYFVVEQRVVAVTTKLADSA